MELGTLSEQKSRAGGVDPGGFVCWQCPGLGAVQSPCPARAASLSWAQEALSPALSCAELPVLRVQLPL